MAGAVIAFAVVVQGGVRFWLGLLIGMLTGGGAVYLALEQPWQGNAVSDNSPDAGVEVAVKGKKKPRRPRKRRPRPGGDAIPDLTTADRKMMWKGEAVKLPARSVDFAGDGADSAGNAGRPLSGSEINQALQGQSSQMIACITQARGNAELQAKITLKMLVDGTGRVKKARVRAPAYLFAHGFYACARKAARAFRFPATGGHTVVDAPFDLY